jgi:hypothetical protein
MGLITYDNPWTFNGKDFDPDDAENHEGFVYCIHGPVKQYIGRKYFWTRRKSPKTKRRVKKESDWKEYYGSSNNLTADIELLGKGCFRREIISMHKTRGDVNYTETKIQFVLNVLESDKYYNDNILVKYKRRPEHIMEARLINEDWSRYF